MNVTNISEPRGLVITGTSDPNTLLIGKSGVAPPVAKPIAYGAVAFLYREDAGDRFRVFAKVASGVPYLGAGTGVAHSLYVGGHGTTHPQQYAFRYWVETRGIPKLLEFFATEDVARDNCGAVEIPYEGMVIEARWALEHGNQLRIGIYPSEGLLAASKETQR